MKKGYYISQSGELMNSVVFGEPYIMISCGSELNFKKKKVRELLSKGISYSVDISEGFIAEIHYSTLLFSGQGYSGIKNVPSGLSVTEFLSLIK